MFLLDVVKVDLDVAYTCMLQVYVANVLGVSTYVASVSSGCSIRFSMATHIFFKSFLV